MNDDATDKSVWDSLKSFGPATWLGLALVVLFLVLLPIDACVVRWWLMLPLALLAGWTLEARRRNSIGLEARICAGAFWLLAALVVLRDVGLSRKLAELFDKMAEFNRNMNEVGINLNRFFEGGR